MMKQGLIWHSVSPFSSLVLLVKKKEGSWWFCVNYQACNVIMVCDHFPIPMMDELIDELHRASICTKLDLRVRYHQIQIFNEDIEKTTFRTHHNHFKFTMMLFSLRTLPQHFKLSWINCLRKYWGNMSTFSSMISWFTVGHHKKSSTSRNSFSSTLATFIFIRKSNCIFGMIKLIYLGHIVSSQEVSLDPNKINAFKEWPEP